MIKLRSMIDLALTANADSHKVSCAAYDKRGRLIVATINDPRKSHPLMAKYAKQCGEPERINLHAEARAVILADKDIHTLHVVRVGPKGIPKPSLPCHICRSIIQDTGIKEVVYLDNELNWTSWRL